MLGLINQLSMHLASLPNISYKNSMKIVAHLMENKEYKASKINQLLKQIIDNSKKCEICWNIDADSPCSICKSTNRDRGQLCVVENYLSLLQIENCAYYKGIYHIIGGVMSAAKSITPKMLNIHQIQNRIKNENFQEIIIAISPSDESVITIEYLIKTILETGFDNITKISEGIPYGQRLDSIDEGTIVSAIASRVKT